MGNQFGTETQSEQVELSSLSVEQLGTELSNLKSQYSQLKKELELITGKLNAINATMEIVSLNLQATGAFPSAANIELQNIKMKMQKAAPKPTINITSEEHKVLERYKNMLILQGYKLTDKQLQPSHQHKH